MPQREAKHSDRIIWALIGLLLLSNYVHVNSWYERTKLREEAEMSRRMLNARAIIQVTLAKAAKDDRRLTAEEQQRIRDLWAEAQYDRVMPKEEL